LQAIVTRNRLQAGFYNLHRSSATCSRAERAALKPAAASTLTAGAFREKPQIRAGKSAADNMRPPGRCVCRKRRIPSPVATSKPSLSAPTTSPTRRADGPSGREEPHAPAQVTSASPSLPARRRSPPCIGPGEKSVDPRGEHLACAAKSSLPVLLDQAPAVSMPAPPPAGTKSASVAELWQRSASKGTHAAASLAFDVKPPCRTTQWARAQDPPPARHRASARHA